LLINGSFEEPVTESTIPGWNKWLPGGDPIISVVDDEAIDGENSVYISGNSGDDRGALVQSVSVDAGETYVLSYWAKTNKVEGQGAGVTTRVQFKDNKEANTANMIYVGRYSGTNGWRQSTNILEIPERTSHIKIEPILDQASGEVWFDNFVLEKLDTTKPPEFTAFSVDLLDTGSVQLDWNMTYFYPDQVMFNIYRSSEKDFEPGPELLLATTIDNHYVDRTTSVDQTYYYRVVLIDESTSNTSMSGEKEITIIQTSPPNAPDEFKSSVHISGGAWLSWKLDEVSRAKTVRLYASDEPMDKPEGQYLIGEISANEATFIYDAINLSTYYGIIVVDVDGDESDWITTELQRILPPVEGVKKDLKHPYLFFNEEDISILKQKLSNHGFAEKAFQEMVVRADVAVATIMDSQFQLPEKNSNLHDRLADQARDLALCYLLTEKSEYRDATVKILMEYGENYAKYPLEGTYDGRLLNQTLNESGWLIDFAWAYDMMYQELSEEQRQKIEEDVLHNAADVISRYKRGLSNWQVWHNAAIGMVGLVTKNQALLERVINDPAHGFKYQISNGIRKDGLWWEESNSYHQYTLEPFTYFAEAAYNSNLDMYTYESEDGLSLKTMYDALLNYIFADMTRPAVGNTSLYSPLKSGLLYEIAYKHYKDPNYAWLIQQTIGKDRGEKVLEPYWAFIFAETELPDVTYKIASDVFAPDGKNIMGSTLYEDSGMAILRNHEPEGKATNVSMTWSPYGTTNGHQHADMLSLMLYGNGETLLTEAGSLGYSNPNHISWAKQTLAHNTLVVDETSQYPQGDSTGLWDSDSGKPSSGVLKNIHIGPVLKTITAESDNVYDDVHLERTLVMIDNYVLDWFRVNSDTEHIYDLPYHVNGNLIESSLEFEERQESFRDWGGYQHIMQAKSSLTDNQWNTTWQGNKGSGLNLTMLGAPNTEVVHGVALNELIMARRKGNNADFVTVLQPFAEDKNPRDIEPVEIQADSPAYAVNIGNNANMDMIALGMAGEMKNVSDITFDGSIAFTQNTSGKNDGIALVNGKYYKDSAYTIQLSEKGNVQFTKLDRPHTFRLDYSGSEDNDLELIMDLQPNTKVMAFNPINNELIEHDYTLTKCAGSMRHLEMKLQSGMSYILIAPPSKVEELELGLSAEVLPLYDSVSEIAEPNGKVVETSENLEGIIIEGEDYTGQGGGFVEATEKPGASQGMAIRLWDNAGHWLEWTGNVPEPGEYQVVIRYSTDTETSFREFAMDDRERYTFHFPSTYGWENWSDAVLCDLEGNPLTFDLTEGEHIIYMMNLSSALNVDYIKLVPQSDTAPDPAQIIEKQIQHYMDNDQLDETLGNQLLYRLSIIRILIDQEQLSTAVDYLQDFRGYIGAPAVIQQGLISKEALSEIDAVAGFWIDQLQSIE